MRRLISKEDRLQFRMAITPADADRTTYDDADAFVVRYIDSKERPSARGYIGSSAHADFCYYFATVDARENHINKWLATRRESVANKTKRVNEAKALRIAALDKYPVGTIVYTSWGYEQTNVDFYEVVRRVSAQRVEVRELRQDCRATGDMSGTCTARKGDYESDATKICAINPHGLRISKSRIAWIWDGTPKSFSTYG